MRWVISHAHTARVQRRWRDVDDCRACDNDSETATPWQSCRDEEDSLQASAVVGLVQSRAYGGDGLCAADVLV